MEGTLTYATARGPLEINVPQSPSHAAVVSFSVSVVDGSGRDVYGEPVTATYDLGDGYQRTVTRVTGPDGLAHFADELAGTVRGVTLTAVGETLGPVSARPGQRLVIEA